MDAVVLAKLQFAFTVAYHFFFVPLSVGLGLIVVLLERQYYKSGEAGAKSASQMMIKIFTATFAIGVATGITMEFAFGTNWATYSRFVGDIFGAPLAAEGLFAFFLESTFLGILLFGREKVSKKFYYVSAWLVWAGSMLSALWIIIANSWMQTPAGFKVIETGSGDMIRIGNTVMSGPKAIMTNFFAAGFNPSTLPRYAHTVSSLLVTGAFMAAGIGAYHLLKGNKEFGRRVVSVSLLVALVFSVGMLVTGHFQAVEAVREQPVKMAAMEGHWQTGPMPLGIAGWVDTTNHKTTALELPGGVSFLESFTFTKSFTGLNDIPVADQPPIELTYQTYHLMIIVFGVLILFSAIVWWLNRLGKLEGNPALLKVLMWFWLIPQLGIQMGWAAAEVGRQPWIVQGQLRTADAISKVVPAYQIALTLTIFVIIYALLAVGWARVVIGIIKKGPISGEATTDASA